MAIMADDHPQERRSPPAAFPAVAGASEVASEHSGSPRPATHSPVAPKPVNASPARRVGPLAAFGLVATLGGSIIGYFARPRSLEETRFVNFDPESAPRTMLVSGWSSYEEMPTGDTFAWCAAKSCAVRVQSRADGDRIVRARLSPFRYPEAPAQTVTIFLNGTSLGQRGLVDNMSVVALAAPKASWHKGANDVRFEFAYAEAPKTKVPEAEDTRTLAAAFDWIEIARPAAK